MNGKRANSATRTQVRDFDAFDTCADPVINALLEETAAAQNAPTPARRATRVEMPIETESRDDPECLIAPDVLFPDLYVERDFDRTSVDDSWAERSRRAAKG